MRHLAERLLAGMEDLVEVVVRYLGEHTSEMRCLKEENFDVVSYDLQKPISLTLRPDTAFKNFGCD